MHFKPLQKVLRIMKIISKLHKEHAHEPDDKQLGAINKPFGDMQQILKY